MARNLGPQCKICRRVGEKLFLKGERCYLTKCSLVKRKYPPGLHGPKGHTRLSEYGLHLREKQRLKKTYQILERQLKRYFNQAKKKVGNTEVILLKLLEMRLDNVIYRAGFSLSRKLARQMINHGHILVNQKRVDIPSFQVKVGDIIKIKEKTANIQQIRDNLRSNQGKMEMPAWLSLDSQKFEIKIIKEPDLEDLPKNFNTRLIVEFYSR